MSKEISKSPEMLQKEARIKELHQQIKKERSTLKGLKTRLKNTKQEITDIQRKMSNAVFGSMEKMEKLRLKIIELINTCKKFKTINNADKEQLNMLIAEMEESQEGEEFDLFQKNKESPEFEDEQRAKMHDIFQQFKVKPPQEEQKNIRKIFINLSTNFHPDKARNDKQQKEYHSLMQEINEAYQAGDIDRLLELEKIYLGEKAADFTGKAITVDLLTQEIERLTRDLTFIKNQITRMSAEIKALRKSELGNMLTDINRAEKYGMGVNAMTEDLGSHVENMTELKDILQLCVEEKSMEPMKKFIEQKMAFSPLDFMEGLDMDDDDFFDPESMFDGLFDDEPQPVKNPKFPIGTSVQIKKNIKYPYDYKIQMKGWQGRVINVYKIDDEINYEIQLDSIALEKLPKNLIAFAIDEGFEFQLAELEATDIKKVPPRDTLDEAIATYRTILHKIQWDYLPKKDNVLMQEILLKFPEKSDQDNWKLWLTENLQLPLNGKSRGYYDYPTKTKMKIKSIDQWDDIGGLLVIVDKNGKGIIDHPLCDISTSGKQKKILDLYDEWMDMAF